MKADFFYVYILTNAGNKVLYTGITNDPDAISREKQKGLLREKKIKLINELNSEWKELSPPVKL